MVLMSSPFNQRPHGTSNLPEGANSVCYPLKDPPTILEIHIVMPKRDKLVLPCLGVGPSRAFSVLGRV